MVVLGDPQTYVKNTFSQPIFELMTAWTAAHKDALKIKAVLCTGDLVERNDTPTAFAQFRGDANGNAPSFAQWEFVARAFSRPRTGKSRMCSAPATTTTAMRVPKTARRASATISPSRKIRFGGTAS